MTQKIDRELILRVAKNARLNLSEAEVKEFLPQFAETLKTFEVIAKADVKGVKPAFHPIELKNVFREDKTEKCLSQEQSLSNSAHKKNGYFKGPKVVG